MITDPARGLGRVPLRCCLGTLRNGQKTACYLASARRLPTLNHCSSMCSITSETEPCWKDRANGTRERLTAAWIFCQSLDQAKCSGSTDYSKCRGLSSPRDRSVWENGRKLLRQSSRKQNMRMSVWKNAYVRVPLFQLSRLTVFMNVLCAFQSSCVAKLVWPPAS